VDHVSVDAAPEARLAGLASRVTVGEAAPAVTVTVTLAAAGVVPVAPEQVSLYVVVALTAPVDALPLVAFVPLQPADATHEVALVVLQVKVEAAPLAIVGGLACSTTVGASIVGGAEPSPVTGASADEQAASTRLLSNSAPIARLAEGRHAKSRPCRAMH
jgi:hypothetical protein